VNKRQFITLLGGGVAASWPLAARAQLRERMRRVGVLMSLSENDPEAQAQIEAFRQGLQQLGWTDNRNVRIDYRWAAGDVRRLPGYAAELVGASPDVMLVVGTPALAAARKEAGTTPIVFVQVADPVGSGMVASLAHPGGNITGFTNYEYTMGEKWLGTLKEVAPHLIRVLVIFNPDNAGTLGLIRAIESAAESLRVQIVTAPVHGPAEIERGFDSFAPGSNSGLVVQNDLITFTHRDLIVALAARHRLPAIYPFRSFVASSGLMSYGVDSVDLYRRAVSYIDRILKGEKPADLPVQQPTKYELVINLKTAKALGLEVPPTLLARADEVIE
jgi:ABC-type uncharacterized transport system substrate-binding protein